MEISIFAELPISNSNIYQSCRFDKGLHRSNLMVDIILLLSFAPQDKVKFR